ncbi:MAG: flagellar hook assembly protein FlgD [Oceanicaulis sp.]
MNELNPIGLALPSTGAMAQQSDETAGAADQLADNFDTFLTLLTEQLQNQDPLNPMDSQEFVGQLVQFSSVEQLISSNQSLETLLALQSADARMGATDFIGREVTVSSNSAPLENGEARWTYALPREAASNEIMVTDAQGRVVATFLSQPTGQGAHDLAWNGRDAAGNPMPPGVYTLEVVAKDADGRQLDAPVRVTGRATGVDMSGEDVVVEIGALRVPAGRVVGVREPGA